MMKYINTKLLFIILLSMFSTASAMFEAYIENGIGVRSIGMAEAYYHAEDVESAFYNPAQIAAMNHFRMRIAFNKKWEDLSETYLAFVYPFNDFNLGLTYFNSGKDGGIIGTSYDSNSNENVLTGKTHSYYASLLMLSGAKKMDENLSLGLNLKHFSKNLSIIEASALALDGGVYYKFSNSIKVSAKITNLLATEYQWETENEKPQMGINAGIGIEVMPKCFGNIGIEVDGEGMQFLLGAEGNMDDVLFYRAGFNKDVLALGIGMKLDGVNLDYAFNYYTAGEDLLGAVHRFGVEFDFDIFKFDNVAENNQLTPEEVKQTLGNKEEATHSLTATELEMLKIPEEKAFDIEKQGEEVYRKSEEERLEQERLEVESRFVLSVEELEEGFKGEKAKGEERKDVKVGDSIDVLVKLVFKNSRFVFSGQAKHVNALMVDGTLVAVRSDNKFFNKKPVSRGQEVELKLYKNSKEKIVATVKKAGSIIVLRGNSSIKGQHLYVNNHAVYIRSDGKFFQKIKTNGSSSIDLAVR